MARAMMIAGALFWPVFNYLYGLRSEAPQWYEIEDVVVQQVGQCTRRRAAAAAAAVGLASLFALVVALQLRWALNKPTSLPIPPPLKITPDPWQRWASGAVRARFLT